MVYSLAAKSSRSHSDNLIFDLPVTYNKKVSRWVAHYQGPGNRWFRTWLQRSYKYMPFIQAELKKAGLPLDLAYMVMIESGFAPNAVSHASAVGPWQFIEATGSRYGLNKNWWLDERRDLKKSTLAAIRYIKDLHAEFGSWYLVAASYNMGENGLRRKIKKHGVSAAELRRAQGVPRSHRASSRSDVAMTAGPRRPDPVPLSRTPRGSGRRRTGKRPPGTRRGTWDC